MKNSIRQIVEHAFPEIKAQQREHGEKDQAKIRFVVAFLLGLYCIYYVDPNAATATMSTSLLTIFTILSLCAVSFYLWIRINPKRNPLRIVSAMAVDIGLLSYAMSIAGVFGGPWYPVYLWVTFGNGFRYGIKYLFIASAISVTGFATVIATNSWWHTHMATGVGLLIGLIILPLYVSTLLRSLQSAISTANEASKIKSRFLANMSHELRTPLNGVIATADLLKEHTTSSDSKQMVHTISNSAEALLELINQILDIGKIEAGKMQAENIPFQLRNMLNSTVDIVSSSADRKGLKLFKRFDTNIPDELVGDPTHTRQILVNLLSNAVKFTHEGYVSLSASLVEISESTATVRFEVSDTGIGISKDAQKRIFDAFTQADESTTRKYGGTGLGTAICKELTELLGGNITLDSTPGIGTTFAVEIPFVYKHSAIDISRVSGMHIVVIGDTQKTLDMPLSKLREWGIKIDIAADIDTAARLVEHYREGLQPIKAAIVSDQDNNCLPRDLSGLFSQDKMPHNISVLALCSDSQTCDSPENRAYIATLNKTPTDLQLFNALVSCNSAIASAKQGTEKKHSIHQNDGRRLHLLVADDNATNRKVISMVMQQLGHDADIVNDGSEALDALEQNKYDAVIVDMHMPVLGGIDVFKTYRFSHPESKTPFILLTADATTHAVELATDLGFDSFITKPFRPKELQEKLLGATKCNTEALSLPAYYPDTETSTKESDGSLVDYDVLMQLSMLSGDNNDLVSELIFGYLNDASRSLSMMEKYLESGDYSSFNDIAHALKGSSGSIGARSIYEICSQIGNTAINELPAEGPVLMKKIKTDFTYTKHEFIRHSQNLGGKKAINSH